jgi:CDP-6-deoxy-D-xylo-4-hexulose-3-dehydrase
MRSVKLVSDTIDKPDINALIDWLHGTATSIPQLTKGPITPLFEKQYSDWLGTRHSVFVNSGSSAILLGLAALKFGGKLKNDTIICPDLSWATDVSSPLMLGLNPVLIDANREDLSVDLDRLEWIFKLEKPAAFILVSVLGLVPDMDRIVELCTEHDVLLLEDVCESLGSEYKGKKLGTFGCMSFFSMYYGHHISTIEGGMVCTSDEEINDLLLMIRSHGWDRDLSENKKDMIRCINRIDDFSAQFAFYLPGLNVRSTDFQAVLGLRQIGKIDMFAKLRNLNFKLYQELLDEDDSTLNIIEREDCFISSFCYPIVNRNRDAIVQRLRDNNVECRPLIAGSMSMSPMWRKFGTGHTNTPVSMEINKYGLYVPNHQGMTEEDVRNVVSLIKGST